MAKRKLKPRMADPTVNAFEDEDAGQGDSLEDFFGDAVKPPKKSKLRPKSKDEVPAKRTHKTGPAIGPVEFDYDALEKKRKLSKKAKADLAEWKGKDRAKKRDAYILGLAEEARKKFGHRAVMAGSESNNLLVGIPFPSLALEWLFLSDALLLSLVYVLNGKWGCCKSSFLYEIYRWFILRNGFANHNDVEIKFSPDLCQSIIGYSDDEFPIVVNRCYSVEDWQEKLTFWMDLHKQRLVGTAEKPGPGRIIPGAFGIDSVMARSTIAKQEKIATDGYAGKGYPDEAGSITGYLRGRAQELENWPFALFLVNHLKTDINRETNSVTYRNPGGEFASFQESFELRMSKWQSKISTDTFDGIGVRIETAKNSMAEGQREIFTRMLWWDEPVGVNPKTGQTVFRQKTVWDWDWSTVYTLSTLPGKYKNRLKDQGFVLKVKSPKAPVENGANCRMLGMGKEEYLPFSQVGEMIRKDPKLMEVLRTALGIKRRPIMKGDYLEQLDSLGGKLT